MPVLVASSGVVLFLLTLVFVFIEFGKKSCCGQYRFLAFFNLIFIAPIVVWTAMVVSPMGLPNEDKNPLKLHMGWWNIGGFDEHYSNLQCDPVFWKHAFYFVCLLCALESAIFCTIFVTICKVTCRCFCAPLPNQDRGINVPT